MQMSDRWSSPHFVIFVLLPVLFAIWLLYEAWQWLQRSWPAIHGYVIAGVVALVVVGATWIGWRAWAAWKMRTMEIDAREQELQALKYHNQIAQESHLLVQDARTNMDNVDIKYGPGGVIDSLKVIRSQPLQGQTRVIEELREQIQVLQAQTLALPAPDTAIPDVVNYRDVEREVPGDLSLLGVYPETGNLEIVGQDKYKTAWFVGASSSGKTNTVYGKVADAVRWGSGVIICDIHGAGSKQDSLTNQLRDFHGSLIIPIATTKEQIKDAIVFFLKEFMARRDQGKVCTKKWLIVVDEVNAVNRMPVKVTEEERTLFWETLGVRIKEEVVPLEVFVKALAETCGYESRGFEMFGYFISQKVAHLAWLRNAMMTIFVHRLVTDSEAYLAANNDRKMADLVKTFKRGRTLVYGVEFEQPIILQQALYNKQNRAPIVDSTIYNAPTMDLSQSVPGNQATMLMERPQERAQEASGTNTEDDRNTSTFELKKLLNAVGQMKAQGKSNAEILKQYNLHASGRNNTNLSVLIGLIGDTDVEDGASK